MNARDIKAQLVQTIRTHEQAYELAEKLSVPAQRVTRHPRLDMTLFYLAQQLEGKAGIAGRLGEALGAMGLG